MIGGPSSVAAIYERRIPVRSAVIDRRYTKFKYARSVRSLPATDDLGYKTDEQPVTNHDLHATLLHLLGIDHKRLTFYFNGRNMRLTDVYGDPIRQIVT